MTIDVRITIDDAEVQRMLSRAPRQIGSAFRAGLLDGALYIKRILTTYPPPPPNSTYRRTLTLGRSWFTRTIGSGLDTAVEIYSAGNMAPYNRKVQSRPEQARIHRGRWPTAQGVAEQSRQQVTQFLVTRLQQALGR